MMLSCDRCGSKENVRAIRTTTGSAKPGQPYSESFDFDLTSDLCQACRDEHVGALRDFYTERLERKDKNA